MNHLRSLTFGLALILAFGATTFCQTTHGPLTVETASIDRDGLVHIKWSGNPDQVMPPDQDAYCDGTDHCAAVGAEALSISTNRRSVGWTADYAICCQSYPAPMSLVIARNGQVVHTIHGERPIYRWKFEQGDSRIALFSDTTHGNMNPTCELYDTQTWKRIADWYPGKTATIPLWAKPFAQDVSPQGKFTEVIRQVPLTESQSSATSVPPTAPAPPATPPHQTRSSS